MSGLPIFGEISSSFAASKSFTFFPAAAASTWAMRSWEWVWSTRATTSWLRCQRCQFARVYSEKLGRNLGWIIKEKRTWTWWFWHGTDWIDLLAALEQFYMFFLQKQFGMLYVVPTSESVFFQWAFPSNPMEINIKAPLNQHEKLS